MSIINPSRKKNREKNRKIIRTVKKACKFFERANPYLINK